MASVNRPLRLAVGALAVFAAVFVASGLDGWGPPAPNEAAIGEPSRWCERVSGGLLREPVNTLGNLGFVVAGLSMLAVLGRDRRRWNWLSADHPVGLLYAAAVVFLGPGSMLMHGTHTRFGAWMDNVSMVAYILVPWLVNLAGMGRWSIRRFFAAYGILLGGYAAGYWFQGPDLGIGLDLFGVSIALWMISEALYRWWSPTLRWLSGLLGFGVAALFGITPARMSADPAGHWWVALFWVPGVAASGPAPGRRRAIGWFWLGVASFLVAYGVWLTGTDTHPLCDPDSPFQAHALWHLLTAWSTWCFFWYLRSEEPVRVGV